MHKSVLINEAVEFLKLKNNDIIVDATLGCGGHAEHIINKISPRGLLIGIDRDKDAIEKAGQNLSKYDSSLYKIFQASFSDIDTVLGGLNINRIDGILFDLGVSSLQLDDGLRGFSVRQDGPLDMRMDKREALTAADIVNRYPEERLRHIISEYGEERFARKIACEIVKARKEAPIKTTKALATIIIKAVGYRYKKQKIHPATRTFQAIRIETNRELDALSLAIRKLPGIMKKRARACVISFHSLEDRIVKKSFREFADNGICALITKKPVTPGREEVLDNPRSRSAKLRIAEF